MQGELTLWLGAALAAVALPIALVVPRRHLLYLLLATLVLSVVHVSFAGNNIKPYQFLLPLVALRYLPVIVRNARHRAVAADWLTLLLMFAFLYSLTYTVEASRSIKDLTVLVSLFLLYFIMRFSWNDTTELQVYLSAFLAGAAIVVAWGFVEFVLTLAGVNLPVYVPGRLQSTFVEPDWLGNYICFILPVSAICYLFRIRTRFAPHFLMILNVSLFVQLLLSYTRGAWLAFIATVAVFSFFQRRYLKRILKMAAVLAVLLGLLLGLENYLPGELRLSDRLRNIVTMSSGTGLYRRQICLETLLLCYQREGILWRGYGPGTFGLIYTGSDPTNPQFSLSGPANAYISLLFAYGVATTLLFLVAMGWPMWLFLVRGKKLGAMGQEQYGLALAFFLSLLAQLLSIGVSNSVTFPFLWVSVAMLVNYIQAPGESFFPPRTGRAEPVRSPS